LLDAHDIFDCDEVDTGMSHSEVNSTYFTDRITGFEISVFHEHRCNKTIYRYP